MAKSASPQIDWIRLASLVLLLVVCAGFTIGLTFAPCYSSLCVEQFFPYQARVHLALFYSLLAGILLYRIACIAVPWLGKLSAYTLSSKPIPGLGKRPTVGGILLCFYLVALIFGSIGYWYPAQNRYWTDRAAPVNFTQKIYRLVWTGVTGHWLDILLGLVVLPVGRNSVLGRTLHLQGSTLLVAHNLLGYALCAGGLIHGLLYYSYLAAWVDKTSDTAILDAFAPDNPTLTFPEAIAKGPYAWFTLPTGAIVGIILVPVMVITSLPILRRLNYNTFYFLHVTFAFLVLLLVCLHASTDFYCLLPGLLLYVYDLSWRLRHSIARKTHIDLQDADNGWYRIVLPLTKEAYVDEKNHPASPLQTYYINIPEISFFESHPFTAASVGSSTTNPLVLLRKSPERKKLKKRDKEWTWKLGTLADTARSSQVAARIEGPYSPSTPALYTADHVLAIVGGTGITGALSIARWWAATHGPSRDKTLRIVWSVRDKAMAQLQDVSDITQLLVPFAKAEVVVHVSNVDGRLDLEHEIKLAAEASARTFVYISGPGGFSADAENACWIQKRTCERSGEHGTLDWYIASYAV